MNPKASGVEVLVPKPVRKIVFKFSDDKLIIKENPSDQNPVISKALGKNSSTTESEKELKSLETREKKSKSQVERKRNVSPEAEKSKSKKRRTMVSLELSEEWIIADVLGMTEGKPLKRPKKNKSLVGMIHNHFTPGAMFASKNEFHPHSFPQFMDTFLHDTSDELFIVS